MKCQKLTLNTKQAPEIAAQEAQAPDASTDSQSNGATAEAVGKTAQEDNQDATPIDQGDAPAEAPQQPDDARPAETEPEEKVGPFLVRTFRSRAYTRSEPILLSGGPELNPE